MLTLCHYSTATYEPKTSKIVYNSRSKEEEIILEFCQNCNFSFIQSNKHENPDIYQLKLMKHINLFYLMVHVKKLSF